MNKKTAHGRTGATKSNHKAIEIWKYTIGIEKKQKGHSKLSEEIKKSLYNWIMHHPQVVQSPIANDCLKMKIDGYTEPQPVPKLLLQVSVRET